MDRRFPCGWSGGTPVIAKNPLIEADSEVNFEITLATGTVTDLEQQLGFDVANIKGLLITVEDNDLATVTMETNATDHSGGQIFTFPIGGGELYWTHRSPLACPLTTDVTTMFFSKTGADTPTVRFRCALNG